MVAHDELQQRLELSVNGLCPWQFACAYCAVQVDAGLWAQTRPDRAPTGGPCLQRVQHQRINAIAERRPAAAELVDALHPGKVTSGPFDHCEVVDGLKHPHQQFRGSYRPRLWPGYSTHDQNPDRIPMLRKCQKFRDSKASSATPARSSPRRRRPVARSAHAASFLRSWAILKSHDWLQRWCAVRRPHRGDVAC